MTLKRALLAFALLGVVAPGVSAHEVRPAYLELRQTAPDSYDVLWKVPGQGDLRFGIYAQLPPTCTNVTPPRGSMVNSAYTERFAVRCPGGLGGGTIHVAGLSATVVDVLVRLQGLDDRTQVTRLTPSQPFFVVEAAPRAIDVAATYLGLGVEHILFGIDHLLFVLALLLLVKGTRRLIATVTAFTLAHSLTLAGATLGLVHAPRAPVEAAIALSIAFVAAELIHRRRGKAGVTERFPWVVAFTFGLLHGVGFASALSDVGLPQSAIPVALLCFNLGVEIGQLCFIAAAVTVMTLGRHAVRRVWPSPLNPQLSTGLRLLPAYAIGGVAMFWVIQRIGAF